MRRKRKYVLYPEYFDSKRTRSQGRRVPIGAAVPEPTAKKILTAAKYLKLDPEIQSDKAYPRSWWEKNGRILVEKKWSKQKTVLEVAKIARRLKKKEPAKATKQVSSGKPPAQKKTASRKPVPKSERIKKEASKRRQAKGGKKK